MYVCVYISEKGESYGFLGPPVRGPLVISLYILIQPYLCKHFAS